MLLRICIILIPTIELLLLLLFNELIIPFTIHASKYFGLIIVRLILTASFTDLISWWITHRLRELVINIWVILLAVATVVLGILVDDTRLVVAGLHI